MGCGQVKTWRVGGDDGTLFLFHGCVDRAVQILRAEVAAVRQAQGNALGNLERVGGVRLPPSTCLT